MTRREVLYVDDSADMRDLVFALLSGMEDIHVTMAGSAREALAVLNAGSSNPGLFLLDLMMPQMDGLGLLQELRTRDRWRFTPIFFLTARSAAADVEGYMRAGASGVLAKPFDVVDLKRIFEAPMATLHQDKLKRLRERFVNRCSTDAALLEGFVQHRFRDRGEVVRIIHTLSGTAGSFGAKSVGEIAAGIDERYAECGEISSSAVVRLCRALRSVE